MAGTKGTLSAAATTPPSLQADGVCSTASVSLSLSLSSARDLADRYLLVAEFAMRYNQVMLILMEAMQTASRVFMLLGFELSHLVSSSAPVPPRSLSHAPSYHTPPFDRSFAC